MAKLATKTKVLMPACPKCKTHIYSAQDEDANALLVVMNNREQANIMYNLDRDDYEPIESDDLYYRCPECYVELVIDDLEAFFAGKEPAKLRAAGADRTDAVGEIIRLMKLHSISERDVLRAYNDSQVAVAIWVRDDVHDRAKEKHMKVTDSEADAILERVDNRQDCGYGITWDSIDCELDDYKK